MADVHGEDAVSRSVAACSEDVSFSGVDQTPVHVPGKVWRCDGCGAEGTVKELDRHHAQARGRVAPWREAHPRDAIQRIADRPCDIFVDPFTCISENVPDNEVCDPCRLIACGAHDLDWSLLDG